MRYDVLVLAVLAVPTATGLWAEVRRMWRGRP